MSQLIDIDAVSTALESKFNERNDEINELRSRIQDVEQKGVNYTHENSSGNYNKQALETFYRTGDKELMTKSMSIAVDATGGYTHISELANQIIMAVGEVNPLMREVSHATISANVYDQLFTDSHGASARSAESGTRNDTATANFQKTSVTLFDLYAYPKITNELINSSQFNIAAFIEQDTRQQFSEALGTEFVTGNGSTQSVGLLNSLSASGESTSPELPWGSIQYITSGSPEQITYAALLDLISTLPVRYKAAGNCKFFMSTTAIEEVRGLLDSNNLPIWRQDFGIAGAPMVLLGYPVVEVPQLDGQTERVLFGDMKQAYAFVSHQRGIGVLRDELTSPGFTKFYISMQCAGGVMDSRAIKALRAA